MSTQEVKRAFGHLLMIESLAAHQAERSGDEIFESRLYCISTVGGLTQCGRTALRLLKHCYLRNTRDEDICPTCMKQMVQVVKDIKSGVRVTDE